MPGVPPRRSETERWELLNKQPCSSTTATRSPRGLVLTGRPAGTTRRDTPKHRTKYAMSALIEYDTETPEQSTTTTPTTSNNWFEVANYDDFVKWAYKTSPYRVVAHLGDRGHWEAIFTSAYPGDSYLIRGNCGGGNGGRMLAVAAAKQFMEENKYGCPPPGDYE